MDDNKQLLAQTMAFLLCTTQETPLGKLLHLCLAAKVDPEYSGKSPMSFAQSLMEHPEALADWIAEVVESDNDYSVDEMVAISEMHLKAPTPFMEELFTETATIDIHAV